MSKLTRKDWSLLALYVAPLVDPSGQSHRLTSIQIQKALFVLGELRRDALPDFYEFIPYHYGPYSREIANDLQSLQEEGFVEKLDSSEWEITLDGLLLGERLAADAPVEPLQYLKRLTSWVRHVPVSTLLREIYQRFPAYARRGDTIPDD